MPQWALRLVRDWEVSGSNPGGVKYFPTACRSRAILSTLVGLCLTMLAVNPSVLFPKLSALMEEEGFLDLEMFCNV